MIQNLMLVYQWFVLFSKKFLLKLIILIKSLNNIYFFLNEKLKY